MRQLLLHIILILPHGLLAQSISLSGFINEKESGENLPFVNIIVKGQGIGTYSNNYGFYSIRVQAKKEIELQYSCIGYETFNYKLEVTEDSVINIELAIQPKELKEIVITPMEGQSIDHLGQIQMPLNLIKQLPSLLGEKDIIKLLQLLPGVQRGTEGSTALYVRGGGSDQNLILVDDAQVYNSNHLFGFFSVFNGDAIKSVEYWKGGFPARYGGRVSSVIDMKLKEGNKEKLHGEGGIGLLSSRLTLEGPIKKDKSSFLIAARRTYLDLVTLPFMNENSKFRYRFYDLNAKVNFEYNNKNRFFISNYFGNDNLYTIEKVIRTQSTINSKTTLGWGNSTVSFRWNHVFTNKIFLNTTLLFSHFNFLLTDQYSRKGSQENETSTEYKSTITDYSIKADLDYFISNKHAVKTGVIFTNHVFQPRSFLNTASPNIVTEKSTQTFQNQELGLYLEDTWSVNKKFDINSGVRFNSFNTTDKFFLVAEPRLNLTYSISSVRLKGSYARTNQFVHLLSNTGIGLSTDLWVPATLKAPPQQADLVSIGISRDINNQELTISIESYRKYLRNIIAYQEGASFLTFDDGAKEILWEDNITTGKGLSYGTEVLLQKNKGRITGWLGYTLSWTVHQFDELNYGEKFYPKYDSRHNLSLVCVYKLSSKILLSANWLYNTGNALNVPQGYYYGNFATGANTKGVFIGQNTITNEIVTEDIRRVSYFGSRNSFRAEAYHRLDISIQFHKKKKKYERYWEFGLFNAYNRKNPFYYYLQSDNNFGSNGQKIELVKKSLFPILPSINYNFKF